MTNAPHLALGARKGKSYGDMTLADSLSHDGLVDVDLSAVEPMIAIGNGRAVMDEDGWTVRTEDGGRAAHYEHTIVVMRGQPLVLTAV